MTCRRARDIDIEAFLIDSAAEGQAEFRTHYPDCVDCSAAVARWSAFDLAVRSTPSPEGVAMGAHPALERLEQLIDSPTPTGSEEVMIRSHVDRCPQCQTEMSVLSRFDPELLAGLVAAAGGSSRVSIPVAEPRGVLILDPIRRFFESLTEGLDLRPAALAAIAVAILAVFGIRMSNEFGTGAGAPEQAAGRIQFAENEKQTPPTLNDPPPSSAARGAGALAGIEADGALAPDGIAPLADELLVVDSLAVELLADEPLAVDPRADELLAVEPQAVELRLEASDDAATPRAAARPEPQQLAQTDVEVDSTRDADASAAPPRGRASVDPKADVAREEILLAALTELPLPSYGAPPGSDSVGWMRQFGAVRGRGGASAASIASQAPDHVGLTLSSAPTLWWDLDARTELPIQITVVDDEAIEPLMRVDLAGPHAAGLHSIALAEHGVELESDLEYRWFVTVVVDADRPSRNPVSGGTIRVVSEADSRRIASRASAAAERGHVLAELGLWYDAYDFFAALSAAHPELASLARHRERMMELGRGKP